jgi:hypothetical protein
MFSSSSVEEESAVAAAPFSAGMIQHPAIFPVVARWITPRSFSLAKAASQNLR